MKALIITTPPVFTAGGLRLIAEQERAVGNIAEADRLEHQARRRVGTAKSRLGRWARDGRSHGFWLLSTRIGLITLSGRPGELGRYRWSAAGKKGRSNTLAAAKNAVIKAIKGPKQK